MPRSTVFELIGRKAIDTMDRDFAKLTPAEQRHAMATVLADDLPGALAGIASAALPVIWHHVKQTPLVRRALTTLSNITGVDLNDSRAGYLGN